MPTSLTIRGNIGFLASASHTCNASHTTAIASARHTTACHAVSCGHPTAGYAATTRYAGQTANEGRVTAVDDIFDAGSSVIIASASANST